jgi:hypothetical protein
MSDFQNYKTAKQDDFLCGCQCGNALKADKILILKDDERFYDRLIFVSVCPNCQRINTVKCQTDNKGERHTKHEVSSKANRMLKRERKNIINLQNLVMRNTCGLCYGINKAIRNKKGEITQIRQYACDFNSKRDLIKKVYTK